MKSPQELKKQCHAEGGVFTEEKTKHKHTIGCRWEGDAALQKMKQGGLI